MNTLDYQISIQNWSKGHTTLHHAHYIMQSGLHLATDIVSALYQYASGLCLLMDSVWVWSVNVASPQTLLASGVSRVQAKCQRC